MPLVYSITYKTENTYEHWVTDAYWQFLITPEQNSVQELIHTDFNNSLHAVNEDSINGYGFKTIRVNPKQRFREISFEASFQLIKKEVNPFDFNLHLEEDNSVGHQLISTLDFKVNYEPFLRSTAFTTLPRTVSTLYIFDTSKSIFENLQALTQFTFEYILFKIAVTDVDTKLDEIIEKKQGVCQDFAHLFCALARKNGIPSRYVSGYLHQGNGYFGDSQMHAWVEAYIPKLGWVGFDPTNNLLASENHIKVAHGKDYADCAPLRGIIYTTGTNKTRHSVTVIGEQQQQQ